MLEILALLFPFFGLILIGAVAARATGQQAEALGWMNTFIIYAALPALFFKLVSRTPLADLTRVDFILADLGATYLVFVLLFAAGRLLRENTIGESTIQAFGGAYGNIGYMGPGLALLALGEQAAVPVALIVCFENALHFVVAPASMAVAGGDRRSTSRLAGDIFRKVILHPFILSCGAGFIAVALKIHVPAPVQQLIDTLALSAAPCALFAMGVTLALRPLKRVPAEIYYIVPVKLLVHPLVVWLVLAGLSRFDPVWVQSAILLAALPTAANVFVIGQQYATWQERASATILISTMLSVPTIALVLYLLRSGALPLQLFP